MPPLAIAGLAAAASIGGSVLGASSQNKASRRAVDAQLTMQRENNALTQQFEARNEANFQPNLQSGFRANSLIDSFLYGPQMSQAPGPAPSLPANGVNGTVGAYGQETPRTFAPGDTFGGYGATNQMGARNLGVLAGQQPQQGAAPPMQAPAQPQGNQFGGYEAFQASPYYQFPLQEGLRGLDHANAASGMLDSGAARKRGIQYASDYASQRQGEFLGLAQNQANRGVQGAGAIAGVGLNALNNQTQNNQTAADAISNAALLRGQNNANLYGSIGNALGGLAGSFASGYGGK